MININKLFAREEINSNGMCPTYLFRWTLLATRWFKVYLHHFVADDCMLDLHDHPKNFVTIGLCGRYLEQTLDGEHIWCAPWIRSFPATHAHRILMIAGGECWTISIVSKTVRDWGFWHKGQWVPYQKHTNCEAVVKREHLPE